MTSVHSENNPLAKHSAYPEQYDPTLLFPIARDESWKAQGQNRAAVPFMVWIFGTAMKSLG